MMPWKSVALIVMLLITMGCNAFANDDGRQPTMAAPTNAAGVESWDLRERPTRAEVGMPEGEDFVGYSDLANPRPIEVLLPEGRTLDIADVTMVTFDRITTRKEALSQGDGPIAMDFRPEQLPLDEAEQHLADALKAIGADPAAAARWRKDVDNRPTTGLETDQRIEGGGNARVGYLTIGVGAVFNPIAESGKATLKYHVNFVD